MDKHNEDTDNKRWNDVFYRGYFVASRQVKKERKKFKQTNEQKAVVWDKFNTVWYLIYDMGTQFPAILQAGKLHPECDHAIEVMKNLLHLMIKLEGDFSRCLREDEADFTAQMSA